MDEFLFFLKINRAQKKEFIRTCTRKEWKEEKKTDVGWFEQTWNSMRKAGKDFLAPSCMEGPCSLTHNVDLHPLSDEKEWVGDWGIDWLVYANVFLISRSFSVKQQRQRRRKFKKKKKCHVLFTRLRGPRILPTTIFKKIQWQFCQLWLIGKKMFTIYSPYIPHLDIWLFNGLQFDSVLIQVGE